MEREEGIEVKNRKKLGIILGVLIGIFLVQFVFVFAGYLFFDTQTSSLEILGNNSTVSVTTPLTANIILSNSNGTGNITYSNFAEYVFQTNKTVNLNTTVKKTLLDSQCLNFENDCNLVFYIQPDNGGTYEFGSISTFSNPMVFGSYGGGNGKIKIKYIAQCIPTSCHQSIQANLTITEI